MHRLLPCSFGPV